MCVFIQYFILHELPETCKCSDRIFSYLQAVQVKKTELRMGSPLTRRGFVFFIYAATDAKGGKPLAFRTCTACPPSPAGEKDGAPARESPSHLRGYSFQIRMLPAPSKLRKASQKMHILSRDFKFRNFQILAHPFHGGRLWNHADFLLKKEF